MTVRGRLLAAGLAVLSFTPPPYARAQSCVEARVGQEKAYSCVNDALARLARMAHAPLQTNTLDARAPAPEVGTFDRAATAERMGNAFGHSTVSQRPSAPVFANPVFANPVLPRTP